MHKGRVYELEARYRVFAANNTYPSNWPPASITVETATWAGTAAAFGPAAPFYLLPTGITPDLHARYESDPFDIGGGEDGVLGVEFSVVNSYQLAMRITGDWGSHGSLPDNVSWYISAQWSSMSSFFNGTSTPPELFLRPHQLVWVATPW